MNFNFQDNIVLANEYVLLRPIEINDRQNLLQMATADKTLLQFSPHPIYSKELLVKYIDNAISERENQTRYSFSIFSKTKHCFAGSTAFLNISNNDDRLEIGATWLDKQLQGTGLNRQCKYLLLNYAFHIVNAHRVEFKTDERNIQSRKAIEKIGGKFEGILREHTLMYDGYRRNTCYYSVLKNEWTELKGTFIK